jgi:carbamoyltransferase
MTVTYYLSAYVPAVGAAAFYWQRHDQCVALWRQEERKVELVRYWELERLSGLKHHSWPFFTHEHRSRLFETLVRTEGLTLADIREIWGLPDAGDSGAIQELARSHGVSVHSIGHLFSCLMLDSEIFRNETIVALAIDGGPDFVLEDRAPTYWYSGAVVRGGEMHIRPVQSPGLIYEAAAMAFEQEPGTLMAATSACSCDADIPALAAGEVAGLTFYGTHDQGWRNAVKLVRAAVAQAEELMEQGAFGDCGETRFKPQEHVRTVVMRRIQEIAEDIAVREIRQLADEFSVDTSTAYLGMSGGSALNCPTNSRLLNEFGFRGLLCPPCANDSGQALGLGLAGFYSQRTLPDAEFTFPGAYLGGADIEFQVARQAHASSIADISEFDGMRFVADVEAGPVAWIDGASEIGPRALGHRSFLADPRSEASKSRLNEIKDRQWWRPVAPIVLEDSAAEWFDGGHRSPYMLEVFHVTQPKRERVPAIAHLDGTARIQTIAEDNDRRLHAALGIFAERTGVPILCNTSLNAKGEPIVQTASQAIALCLAKGVPVLYIEGRRVELSAGPAPVLDPVPGPRNRELFGGQEAARDALWEELLGQGIDVEMMALVARAPQLARFLANDRGRARLKAAGKAVGKPIGIDRPTWISMLEHLRATYGPGGTFEGAFDAIGHYHLNVIA